MGQTYLSVRSWCPNGTKGLVQLSLISGTASWLSYTHSFEPYLKAFIPKGKQLFRQKLMQWIKHLSKILETLFSLSVCPVGAWHKHAGQRQGCRTNNWLLLLPTLELITTRISVLLLLSSDFDLCFSMLFKQRIWRKSSCILPLHSFAALGKAQQHSSLGTFKTASPEY